MKAEFVCNICGARASVRTHEPRCECGGLWELSYQAPAWDDALIDKAEKSIFRYRAFMPLEGDAWRGVTLGEGCTPVIRLDENVLLKMDYFMPTLSFKDRGAAVLAAHMLDTGVTMAVQDSSGNAGNSVAAYCARAGIACEVYVPEGTSPGKISMIRAHGAVCHVVPGSRDNCARVCRARVFGEGVYYANHVFNPYFYEGTKTYIYETLEQLGRMPKNIFLPLGNGTLFIGAIKALKHLAASGAIEGMPRIFAVQGERCAPLYDAYIRGLDEPEDVVAGTTLAEGIAIGAPARGRELLALARECGAEFCLAPEEGILPAREALAKKGVFAEHTTAATYAAYIAYVKAHGPLDDCLLPMCGAGLKSEH